MSRPTAQETPQTPRARLFVRLLSWWGTYRRGILLVAILTTLVSLLTSLPAEMRGGLLRGFFEQRALVLLLLTFVLLTLSLLVSVGQRLDIWIFYLLNMGGHHPFWLDRVMWFATQVGNGMAGILLCIFLYFVGLHRFAMELLLGILSLWLTVEITKAIVERSRPFLALADTRVIGWRERGKSFPSGHTSQAFFMVTLLTNHFQVIPMLSALLYGVALLVAFTRIYVGAHYPRDVIGGAILGSVWGIVVGLVATYTTAAPVFY